VEKASSIFGSQRAKVGLVPLPEGMTPHKLRHTYTSLLAALGVDAGAIIDQLRHPDPGFTLRVYRHSMRRDAEARRQLHELVGAQASDSVSGTIWGTNPRKTAAH
jgi:integrase